MDAEVLHARGVGKKERQCVKSLLMSLGYEHEWCMAAKMLVMQGGKNRYAVEMVSRKMNCLSSGHCEALSVVKAPFRIRESANLCPRQKGSAY